MSAPMGITESHAIGSSEPPVRDVTIGDLLVDAAESVPERVALIEGIPDLSACANGPTASSTKSPSSWPGRYGPISSRVRGSRCGVDKTAPFSYMRDHLAPNKTPKQWFAVEEFPLTGSGKIQKFRLREAAERVEL